MSVSWAGFAGFLAASLFCVTAQVAMGQAPFGDLLPYDEDSGLLLPEPDASSPALAYSHDVVVASPWLRLRLIADPLGPGDEIRITSLGDGDSQTLRAEHREAGGRLYSAFLNGTAARLEVVLAPHSPGARIRIDGVDVETAASASRQLCGADNRTTATDPRVARLVRTLSAGGTDYCTAFIISDTCLVTAGHCLEGQKGMTLEFNVPADGSQPPAKDQYGATIVGKGHNKDTLLDDTSADDHGLLACSANTETEKKCYEGQGERSYKISLLQPVNKQVKVLGYGDDDMPPGNVLQSATGILQAVANAWYLQHRVDTKPGNSGSPIVHKRAAIGVHTYGQCSTGQNNYNRGTSFALDHFKTQIEKYCCKFPTKK